MRAYSLHFLFSILSIAFFAVVFFAFAPQLHAATCINQYNASNIPPAGFAPVHNLFSVGQELLVQADLCDWGVARLKAGKDGSTSIYTYKTGYYWSGGGWVSFAFDGTEKVADWYRGLAIGAPTVTSPGTYVVAYTCNLVSLTDFRCGCTTSDCVEANGEARKWSLQFIQTDQICASAPCKPPTFKKDRTDNSCNSCGYTNCDANRIGVPGITKSLVQGTVCWEIDTASTTAYECYIHTPTSVNNVEYFKCKL